MSGYPTPTQVSRYVWNRQQPDAQPGAMVTTRHKRLFIPGSDLRRIADALHDLADDLEGTP